MSKEKKENAGVEPITFNELPALVYKVTESLPDFKVKEVELHSRGYTLDEVRKGMEYLLKKAKEEGRGDS